MDRAEFTSRSSGKLVKVAGGHAFVPGEIPTSLPWSEGLVSALSVAERALGRLAGLAQDLANPHLLIRPFVAREAVLSSRIEGARASLPDLVLFEAGASTEKEVPDVREIANYVRAMEYGLKELRRRPLMLRVIRELHAILMEGVRGGDRSPGKFRDCQVLIGLTDRIEEATFVPPPPSYLVPLLAALERNINQPTKMPAIARLALVHYQFEAIHPFVDGNGRIGRLLISLMLCSEGILPLPLLYLSAYFERTRQQYYCELLRVSQQGSWSDWVTYFARGVASEATDAVDRAARLKKLREDYVARVRTARTSVLVQKLVEELFARPAVTVSYVARQLGVTPRSAQLHVDRLVEARIVKEVTGRKRNRVYVAQGILKAISEPSYGR